MKILILGGTIFLGRALVDAALARGHTVTLWEGRVTQTGPAAQVYRSPDTLAAARVFSDPPLNDSNPGMPMISCRRCVPSERIRQIESKRLKTIERPSGAKVGDVSFAAGVRERSRW